MEFAALQAEHDTLRERFLAGELEPADLVTLATALRSRSVELPEHDRNRFEANLDALERLAGYGRPSTAPEAGAGSAGGDAASRAGGAGSGVGSASGRAWEVLRLARGDSGSVEERIARAERGIAAIHRIAAEATDPGERRAILRSTELLRRLASSLQDGQPQTGSENTSPNPRDASPDLQ